MKNEDLVCARQACQHPLERGYYKIYNQPSCDEPRNYCPRCGRQIVEENRGIRYELSLPVKKMSYNF